MPARACLSADDVAEWLAGRLGPDRIAGVEEHLDACAVCRTLVGTVAASTAGSEPGPSSPPGEDDERPLERDAHVGRYVVVDVLGAGAMGRVYLAYDPELDRKVALKLLHARVADPRLEARLRREAKAMARASHAEVITVYDAGRHGSQLFIAMELVEGGTLRQWVTASHRAWREVLAVYLRAGRGLAQAHAAGLVHRDFKPDNVLIGRDGRVRVTDFGLARAVHASEDEAPPAPAAGTEAVEASLTRTGALLGTPAYMAPEQLRGKPADARSDAYAFCVSLYEGLYGHRPFEGATLGEQLAAKEKERVRAAPAGARVPPRLRRVLLAGLRARPADRPASMAELLP